MFPHNTLSYSQQEAAGPVVAQAAPVEGGENQSPSLQRREEKKESRRAAKAEGRDEQVQKLGITFC